MPLTLEPRKGIWQCSGTVAGVRVRRSLKTAQKSEAEREANRIESAILQSHRDGPGAALTFGDAAQEYRKWKGDDIPKYLERVEDYWKDTLVKDITPGVIKQAAIALLPNGAGSYRNRAVLVPTSAVINYCASIDKCPPVKLRRFPHKPKERRKPATWEWIKAFMAHSSPHLGALACFMFQTGARVGEAIRVTWGDMSLSEGLVTITMGKLNDETRVADMSPELVAALANIPCNRDPKAQVFPYISYNSMKDPWHVAIRRAGIERLTPHCCRHGFATGLLHRKVDIPTVADLGGWKSPEQLFRTYGHPQQNKKLTHLLTGTPETNDGASSAQVVERKARNG
jgi:integrase